MPTWNGERYLGEIPYAAVAEFGAYILAALLVSASILACTDPEPTPEPTIAPAPPEPEPQRNVVILGIDTVRYDSFWAIDEFGGGDRLSPWTDRALRFRMAQAPAPWTIPSVASAMTGVNPRRHGAGRFENEVANLGREVPSRLGDSLPTFAEILSAADHPTAAFVAHPWFKPKFGLARGFSELKVWAGKENLRRFGEEWISARVDEPTEEPFVLYLHFMEAHEAHMEPPAKLAERIAELPEDWRYAALGSAPAGVCAQATNRMCHRYQAYMHAIRGLRQTIAEILEFLQRVDVLEDSIVILYSDHGEEFADHREEEEADGVDPRNFHGFGHGHSLYQELLHVPLVVWAPGRQGVDVDRPVSLIDIAPTAVAASDATFGWEGISLLTPEDQMPTPERALISSGIAYGPEQAAVLLWPWKRIVKASPSQRLLYDLTRDPQERRSIRDPTLTRKLDRVIASYLRADREAARSRPTLTSAEVESLRSLGYLGSRPN